MPDPAAGGRDGAGGGAGPGRAPQHRVHPVYLHTSPTPPIARSLTAWTSCSGQASQRANGPLMAREALTDPATHKAQAASAVSHLGLRRGAGDGNRTHCQLGNCRDAPSHPPCSRQPVAWSGLNRPRATLRLGITRHATPSDLATSAQLAAIGKLPCDARHDAPKYQSSRNACPIAFAIGDRDRFMSPLSPTSEPAPQLAVTRSISTSSSRSRRRSRRWNSA